MAETDSRILEYLEEGLFLYGVGKVQESIARWKKVLELDPKNERALDYIESAGGDVSQWRKAAGGAAPKPAPPQQPPPSPQAKPQSAPPAGSWVPMPPPPKAPPAPSADPFAGFSGGGSPSTDRVDMNQVLNQNIASTRPKTPPPAPRPVPPPVPPPPANTSTPWSSPPANTSTPWGSPPPSVPAPPPPRPAGDSRDELLSKAAALYRAKYYEASLELLERIARDFPPLDDTLKGYLDASKTAFLETLKATWSRTDLVPKPRMGPQQVMQLKLSNEAGFLLSRIDGMSSIDDILAMCGLDQFTALRALNTLLQQGAIELAR